jgi:hypothetical protein
LGSWPIAAWKETYPFLFIGMLKRFNGRGLERGFSMKKEFCGALALIVHTMVVIQAPDGIEQTVYSIICIFMMNI